MGSSKSKQARVKKADEGKHEAKGSDEPLRMIVLGLGGSGKSTLFRVLSLNYGQPALKDMQQYRSVIWSNACNFMTSLCASPLWGTQSLSPPPPQPLPPELEQFRRQWATTFVDRSESAGEKMCATEEQRLDIARRLQQLWATDGIRHVFRHTRPPVDNTPFFLPRLERFANEAYTPTPEEVYNARSRTVGVYVNELTLPNERRHALLHDVGGQRNERQKWMHTFENLSAVVFVFGLAYYNAHLEEDTSCRYLDEAVQAFQEMFQHRLLKSATKFLYFSQLDLLHESLAQPMTPRMSDVWPEFTGRDDRVEDVLAFITARFRNVVTQAGEALYLSSDDQPQRAALALHLPPPLVEIVVQMTQIETVPMYHLSTFDVPTVTRVWTEIHQRMEHDARARASASNPAP